MNTGTPDEQACALRRVQPALGFETRRAFAAALHVDPSRVSRWMRAESPEVMGRRSRLALATLIGSRFWTVEAVTSFLADVGWAFIDGEWQEARAYLRRDLSPALWRNAGPFVGRGDEVVEVRERLLATGADAPRVIVVRGTAGVGKTALIGQVLRDKDVQLRFGQIFYLRMEPAPGESVDAIEERAFHSLLAQTFVGWEEITGTLAWGERAQAGMREALKRKPALLILDGVETWIDLDEWLLADRDMGRLLVTTRRGDLSERGWTLELGPLDPASSRALLTSGIEVDVEEADLAWLLDVLGGLPLALGIANRMGQWMRGFCDLMAELRAGLLDSLEVGRARRGDSVRLAFDASYRRLDKGGRTLFRCLSLFAPPFELEPAARVLGWDTARASRALRTLVRAGLVANEEAGRYGMHSLLHVYAAELCEESDESLLPEWKARFAEYYQNEVNWQAWTHVEGRQWRGSAAERRANVERGCTYARELGRGDLVLGYLLRVGDSFAFAKDIALRERWWKWIEGLVADEHKLARGALEMAEFYLLSGESEDRVLPSPETALSLAQQAKLVLAADTDRRDWVRAALVEIESLLLLSRMEEASALLDGDVFWLSVTGLPEGDPLLYAVWQLCQMAQRLLGEALVPGYVARAQEALARWRAGVTAEHVAQVQALEAMIIEGDQLLEDAAPSQALCFFDRRIAEAEATGDRQGRLINALYRSLVLMEMGEEEAANAARRKVGL